MKMDGSIRSGGVLKKKNSSGCLIIKNKGENKNSVGGLGGLSNYSKQKGKPRLVASDWGSGDDDESLEFMRRKVNDKKLHNGSMGYNRFELEDRVYDRNNVGMEITGERKRSRFDLFEFDEYDEFDGKKTRDEYEENRFKMVEHSGGGNMKEFSVGPSSVSFVMDKREQGSYLLGSSSGRSKGVEYGSVRNKGFELEEDEAHMPISLLRLKYQETANEPIRLQGKNGVLKVMVNKKKKMDLPCQHKNYNPMEFGERKGSRSEDVVKKDELARLPFFPATKPPENQGLFVKDKSVEKKKRDGKSEKVKLVLSKGSKARDSEIDGTDTVLKLALPGLKACISKNGVKKEEERSPPLEDVTPVKGKEGKAKRGGSTEKQILREKIRQMLVDAGWTIDYRRRRNRDYLDAVYINPSGTAYWSIIKAYDALKKQLEEGNGKSKSNDDALTPSFAPLSADLINKLTRQTKKKIELERKRKRKEDDMTKSAKKSAVRDAAKSSDSDRNEERLSTYMKHKYKSRRGKLREVDQENEDNLADGSPKRKPRKVTVEKPSIASNSNVIHGRTSKLIGRCTLLVRSSDKGENSDSNGYVSHRGKSTVLAWLIDSGTAQLSEKVQYMNRKRTRVMLEGWITRDGIHCGCCSKILPVSKFELHAGSKLRQPFQNIFLESGASLLQCQIDAWNRQEQSLHWDFHNVDAEGDDPDDDTCGICGDGGELICCDSCPSTFHQTCLEIQVLPSGDWHCSSCVCKFCGDASGNAAEENDNTDCELIRCSFCEKKYHKSCSQRVYAPTSTSDDASFCGLKCQEVYEHLQKILGVKHELEAGYSWSLFQQTDVSDTSHRGFPHRVECNSKLAVALSIMDECFLPIIDRRSGINIIHNVVYNCGSNFNRLNYGGFYTAILERGDEIISAASIRIHGTRLAEMPFIGTREIYRRQGMCRRLLSAVETELCSLRVGKLVIPSISEHMNTWTTVFGFHQLEDVHKKEIKCMNMLVFPGTDMLQKQLVKQEISDGMTLIESIQNQPQLPVLVEKSDVDLSMEHQRQVSNNSEVCYKIKTDDKVNALDSGSPAPADPSNDNGPVSASDAGCQSVVLLASNGTTAVMSEVENKQKKSSASLKCPITPGESNNISGMENPMLDPPSENQNAFTSESVEFTNIQGNLGSSVKVSEDAPQINVKNDWVESQSGSVFETSVHTSTDKVNGEHSLLSFPKNVVNEAPLVQFNPDLNQLTVPVMESRFHSSIEPSPDSVVSSNDKVAFAGCIIDSTISDVNDNDRCDDTASCTKENVKVCGVQIGFGSSLEVSAQDVAVEKINEYQNTASISTFPDNGESMTCKDHKAVLELNNDLDSVELQKEVTLAPGETDRESEMPLRI